MKNSAFCVVALYKKKAEFEKNCFATSISPAEKFSLIKNTSKRALFFGNSRQNNAPLGGGGREKKKMKKM